MLTQKPSQVVLEADEGGGDEDIEHQLEEGQLADNRIVYNDIRGQLLGKGAIIIRGEKRLDLAGYRSRVPTEQQRPR